MLAVDVDVGHDFLTRRNRTHRVAKKQPCTRETETTWRREVQAETATPPEAATHSSIPKSFSRNRTLM